MSDLNSDACWRALANVDRTIDRGSQFPRNVFVGEWAAYFFFDSDRIFEVGFLAHIKTLLDIERSSCICLQCLDVATPGPRPFLIGTDTDIESYRSALAGPRPGDGFVYNFGRFGCVSDAGQWSIYCERNNEVAVIALQTGVSVRPYLQLIASLKAKQVEDALQEPQIYGLSGRALSASWLQELLREYRPRSR